MQPLWPDEAGDAVLDEWIGRPDSTPEQIRAVHELIDDIKWGREWTLKWHATPDLITRGDLIVRIHDGPIVVIRPFSDQNPEHMFGIVRIIPRAN